MTVTISGNGTFGGTSLVANNIANGSLTTAKMAFSIPAGLGDLNSYGFTVKHQGNAYTAGDTQTLIKNLSSWSSSMVSVYKNNSNMFSSSDFTVTVPTSGTWFFTVNLYMQNDGGGGGGSSFAWCGIGLTAVDGSYNRSAIETVADGYGYNWNAYRNHTHAAWTATLTAGTKLTLYMNTGNLSAGTYRVSQVHWSGHFLGAP